MLQQNNGDIIFLPCLWRILTIPSSVPWQIALLEYWTDFNEIRARYNQCHEQINDYILGESGTGTMERDTTENSNWRQSVFSRFQTGADA